MKFYLPKFQIATLQPPQKEFRSKFGGLPWGLPIERWSRCQLCGKLMSLLAQLSHDPPALDLGGSEHVLHLFQCQECFGFDTGVGNAAIMVPVEELAHGLTPLPDEDLGGILTSNLDRLVGELWIQSWKEQDDGLDSSLAIEVFDQRKWMNLPEAVTHSMFKRRWRTKMGGIPYWTGNGPMHKPLPSYEFLFQIDSGIEIQGEPPMASEVGGMVIVTELAGQGAELRIVQEDYHKPHPDEKKLNAPWDISVDVSAKGQFLVEITNFGSDGTAYVFINRRSKPADVYWLWNR